MSAYLHPEQRRLFLKSKTRELIAAVGGIEAAAAIVKRGKSTVGRWQDFECADSAPLVCIAALETACGSAIVTAALAGAASRACAYTPAPARAREACAQAFAEFAGKAGRINGELVLALADNVVTPVEARQCMQAIGAVRDTLERMEHHLHSSIETPGPRLVTGKEAG